MVIAFATDPNYVGDAAVAIVSLQGHTPPGGLEIHVLHHGLSPCERLLLERAAAIAGARLHVDAVDDARLALPVWSDYITAATFARLFLGDMLPPTVDRVLYLDCDLLVTGDLTALWHTPLAGHVLAAVRESTTAVAGAPNTYEHPLDPSLDPSQPYFNAGVLLIDLAQWRRERVGERAVDYIRSHRPPMMDQDALNVTLAGRWLELDRMWNVTTFWFRTPSRQKRYRALLRRARIVHFVGHRKPSRRPDVWRGEDWRTHRDRLLAAAGAAAPGAS